MTLRGRSDAGISSRQESRTANLSATVAGQSALEPSTTGGTLSAFPGISQATALQYLGADQETLPTDEDIAVGPTDIVETTNSSIDVFNRSGSLIGLGDLNAFMDVAYPDAFAWNPRVIYDPGGQRFWCTVTEIPLDPSGSINVLVAVSGSSNPLPLTSWLVYTLPIGATGVGATLEPGIGVSSNTVAVTWDDIGGGPLFIGSELDILQKSDLEHGTGDNNDDYFTGGPQGAQPVQGLGSLTAQYVVANDSDCATACHTPPAVEVDAFTGTPEGGGVPPPTITYLPITPTVMSGMLNGNPAMLPADQPSPGAPLLADDDRFLNAVWENGEIWTGGETNCQPSGDTTQRDCLDYLEIAADSTASSAPTLTTQIADVGVKGADLLYPAVTVDSAGDMFTVFDETSTSMLPSIVAATVTSGSSALGSFEILHSSVTYYNPDGLTLSACAGACPWGDYSGAAQDPSSPTAVWVVSSSEDGTAEGLCSTIQACWNTRINELAVPSMAALTPSLGPVAGGQTVTVSGAAFGPDTTATFDGSPITISNRTSTSFTFVTPAGPVGGATDLVQATDALGTSTTLTYTYLGLSNYTPVNPYRILDTRNTGGLLGPGVIRSLQVTGVGSGTQIPADATAAVLNVTEVSGSASSLLTVFPYGTITPTASNLNFAAHTVIANLVTVTLGEHTNQGWIDIYNALGSVNVVVDVEGYFSVQPSSDVQGLFHPTNPVRVCDTRSHSPTPFCAAHGALHPETSMMIDFAIAGGLPSDGSAGAAVVNLTGVAGTSSTYLSLFPPVNGACEYGPGHTPPFSTINLASGAVHANRAMVALGPASPGGIDDAICVYNAKGDINVVIDANGWFGSATAPLSPSGYQFQAIPPTRICDTRVSTFSCPRGAIGTNASRLMPVAGDVYIPAFTSSTLVVAVIANLTAIAPTAPTYLTLYPANLTTHPTASDVNVSAGAVLPNLGVVRIDTAVADPNDGSVYLYNAVGSVNAVIDVEGWFQ